MTDKASPDIALGKKLQLRTSSEDTVLPETQVQQPARSPLFAERAAAAGREVEVEVVAVGFVGLGAEHRAEDSARAAVQAAQERAFLGDYGVTGNAAGERKHVRPAKSPALAGCASGLPCWQATGGSRRLAGC